MDLSSIYKLVAGRDDLKQGDILRDCPLLVPPEEMLNESNEVNEELDIEINKSDVVVMSQSCDIVRNQKQDLWLVVLCPLWSLSKASEVNEFLSSSYGKEMCRRGNLNGYHMLHACGHPDWVREISIVSFRDVYNLPLNVAYKFSKNQGQRLRLKSPYREHLAQAFARFFMRVGLPDEIPPFQTHNAEEKLIQKIDALGEEGKGRVLGKFM